MYFYARAYIQIHILMHTLALYTQTLTHICICDPSSLNETQVNFP